MTKLSHHEAQCTRTTGAPGVAFSHDLSLSRKLSVETTRFVLIGLILPVSFRPLLF